MLGAHRKLRGYHGSLRVGRSQLTDAQSRRLDEFGLTVAANSSPITAGQFLGFYSGVWTPAASTYRGKGRHILEVDGWRITPRLDASAASNGYDIIARVNEPPHDSRANCVFVHFVRGAEVHAVNNRRHEKITAVARPRAALPAARC